MSYEKESPARLQLLAIMRALKRASANGRRRVIDFAEKSGLTDDPEIRRAIAKTKRSRLLRIWASRI